MRTGCAAVQRGAKPCHPQLLEVQQVLLALTIVRYKQEVQDTSVGRSGAWSWHPHGTASMTGRKGGGARRPRSAFAFSALLKNPYIRGFLQNFPEQEWNLTVKVRGGTS